MSDRSALLEYMEAITSLPAHGISYEEVSRRRTAAVAEAVYLRARLAAAERRAEEAERRLDHGAHDQPGECEWCDAYEKERARAEEAEAGWRAATDEAAELQEAVIEVTKERAVYRDRLFAESASLAAMTEALRGVLSDFDALMAESRGVAGLHRNGEVADWDWLLDEWLDSIPAARLRALRSPGDPE